MIWVEERGKRQVRIWLYAVAVMIVGMILLGGLTRLTDSGLSIVEWRVVMGVIPPLSDADWQKAFEQYKEFPQYREHFPNMRMDEFKFIFLMEYSHRLLGRLIGVVFFLPFVFFVWKGWLRRPFLLRCMGLFFLGGLQGFVGWIMVKSGLVDIPRVDHLRLTLHLGLAILVLSLTLWYAYRLSFPVLSKDAAPVASMGKWPMIVMAAVGFQIVTGGMVAGLRAGFAFNTWPTMNGVWVPKSIWSYSSLSQNLFENPVFIQFFHRWFAIAVATLVVFFVFKFWKKDRVGRLKIARILLLILTLAQVLLGIGTLVMRVPISLASLHQMGAVLLMIVLLFFCQQVYEANQIRNSPDRTQGSS